MKKILVLGTVMFAPIFAYAQTRNVNELITFLTSMLSTAVGLILAAAVVYFLWSVFKFVTSAGDEEARAAGQKGIIWGLIGIAVMVSIYGLVNFFTASTGLGGQAPLNVPALPGVI